MKLTIAHSAAMFSSPKVQPRVLRFGCAWARVPRVRDEVLERYDRPKPGVRLHFQIIRAYGSQRADPEIAEVEPALRKLFRFQGYQSLRWNRKPPFGHMAQPAPGYATRGRPWRSTTLLVAMGEPRRSCPPLASPGDQ